MYCNILFKKFKNIFSKTFKTKKQIDLDVRM